MDACIFVLTINSLLPVYAMDRVTQVDSVHTNDKVCVMAMESGDWMKVHWSNGTIGHTGYLHGVDVHQMAQPTEPTPHEEEYNVPPPAPDPPQQQKQNFDRQAPNPDFIVRPAALLMFCQPREGGPPYGVGYNRGHAATFAPSGTTREYPVIKEHDDQQNHVFYVTLQRHDQERAVYAAFDYSQRGEDVSTLATQTPGQTKVRDKCFMDWRESK
jgi:hypothetical protein